MNNFYVYEHWRADKNAPFYVGKGRGRRAWSLKPRNPHYDAVVRKLAAIGLCVEVRLVIGEMSAEQAYAAEIERIAFWRDAGIRLTNMTAGGEGMLNPSDDLRAKLGVISKKRVRTRAWREKIAKAAANLPADSYARRSASLTGIVRSAETRAKVSTSKKNPPQETRDKNSAAAKRSWANPAYRAKQMETRRAKACRPAQSGIALPEGELV